MSLLRSPGQSRLTDGQLDGYGVVHVTAKIVGSLSLLSQKKARFHGNYSKHSTDLILCKTSIIFTGKYKRFI